VPATTRLTLHASARRVANLVWFEERTFEALGALARVESEPAAKLLLARHARHHAWHARVLREWLPQTHDLDAAALVGPAAPALDGVFAEVTAARDPDQTLERLAGVYRGLIPAAVDGYHALIEECSQVADGALLRWLRVVVVDEDRDRAEAEELLGSLDRGRVEERAREVTSRLAAAGGIA
jgi:hypothetical protein